MRPAWSTPTRMRSFVCERNSKARGWPMQCQSLAFSLVFGSPAPTVLRVVGASARRQLLVRVVEKGDGGGRDAT